MEGSAAQVPQDVCPGGRPARWPFHDGIPLHSPRGAGVRARVRPLGAESGRPVKRQPQARQFQPQAMQGPPGVEGRLYGTSVGEPVHRPLAQRAGRRVSCPSRQAHTMEGVSTRDRGSKGVARGGGRVRRSGGGRVGPGGGDPERGVARDGACVSWVSSEGVRGSMQIMQSSRFPQALSG